MSASVRFEEDNAVGKAIGFTPDLFRGWGEIRGNTIYIFYIVSNDEGKKHVQQLIKSWLDKSFAVAVVRPGKPMKHICTKLGFIDCGEELIPEHYGSCTVNVWRCNGTVYV
jgi:hypothetical protein